MKKFKMKNMFKKCFITSVLAFAFIGCESKKEGEAAPKLDYSNAVYIYSWAEYIPPEVFEKFEKETGIKVIEDIYSTNEEMFTKLKAGAVGYDIVVPSPDYAEIMMNENMLAKIDKSKISTYGNIDKRVLKKLEGFDKGNNYAVPYTMSATIIAVNTEKVPDYPRDYSIYDREDLKGRMTLLDDMKEVLIAGLGMEGYPQDTDSEEAMKKAAERIIGWKNNIAKFDSESFGKNFASEDFWVVQGYAENIYMELSDEQIEHTDFVVPQKGGSASIDSFVILESSKNKENAHKFIEFIHKPEIYALVADYLMLPSINVPAVEYMEEEPLFTLEDLDKAELLKDTTPTLELQNKYWEEIKMHN